VPDAPLASPVAATRRGLGAAIASRFRAFLRGATDPVTLDGWLYPIVAGACVLFAATAFYGAMFSQTHGKWSAPLDDVFIHFDYARATARGYPFQWSEGNGFSSGNTSITYPFVLALGYWAFARGMNILVWAAVVACVSTLVFLWTSGELFEPLGRWAKYLAPPFVLALGALDWTLFSGMENAFHLATWGIALSAALWVTRADDERSAARRSWLLGALGALMFLTRPESAISVASFAGFVAITLKKKLGTKVAVLAAVRASVPAALALAVQSAMNRAFTGEWSANGAIVKLAINNPYMSASDKLDDYWFLLKYVALRNTQHHFADQIPWGWLIPILGVVPLFSKRLRGYAVLLWVQAVLWLALVALNGQVRWQNERYTMAAVAWLLLLAVMGLATIASAGGTWVRDATPRARIAFGLRLAGAIAIAAFLWIHQAPNMKDQLWFFGRACRNIRDQQITAGERLHKLGARRVLVGDAGALLYAADTAGLDIIGLGGYKDLPFARAGVHGLGASLELIERMPAQERPDYLALYPSWWGDLPSIFGHRVASVPIVGNVICGDSEKVIYRADWSAFDASGKPRTLRPNERVIDELDVADLVSERRHAYAFSNGPIGFVEYRVLPDAGKPGRDLFDAGRVVPQDQTEVATMRTPSGPSRLILRTVLAHPIDVGVKIGGKEAEKLHLERTSSWSEVSVAIPEGTSGEVRVELTPHGGPLFDAHLWTVGEGGETKDTPVAHEPER
jgi:hypothetical protein